MSDEHRINRDRRETDPDAETFTCDYCGREYADRERYERHIDREKRDQFRGTPIGDAILGRDRALRGRR